MDACKLSKELALMKAQLAEFGGLIRKLNTEMKLLKMKNVVQEREIADLKIRIKDGDVTVQQQRSQRAITSRPPTSCVTLAQSGY